MLPTLTPEQSAKVETLLPLAHRVAKKAAGCNWTRDTADDYKQVAALAACEAVGQGLDTQPDAENQIACVVRRRVLNERNAENRRDQVLLVTEVPLDPGPKTRVADAGILRDTTAVRADRDAARRGYPGPRGGRVHTDSGDWCDDIIDAHAPEELSPTEQLEYMKILLAGAPCSGMAVEHLLMGKTYAQLAADYGLTFKQVRARCEAAAGAIERALLCEAA